MRQALRELGPQSAVDLYYSLKYAPVRLRNSDKYRVSVAGKCGIEIGGPSVLFKTVLPLYPFVNELDGVNFATDTIWEGKIEHGQAYKYYFKKSGRQFITDATDLGEIKSAHYDFLLSSNCLEHVANPFKALIEWKRVIKEGGVMILVLPTRTTISTTGVRLPSFSTCWTTSLMTLARMILPTWMKSWSSMIWP